MTESDISKSIQDYLSSKGLIWFWRNQVYKGRVKSGAYFHTGKKGVSDIILVAYNHTIFIEVKDLHGKQTAEQKQFQEHCKNNNQIYLLARSVLDVQDLLCKISINQ